MLVQSLIRLILVKDSLVERSDIALYKPSLGEEHKEHSFYLMVCNKKKVNVFNQAVALAILGSLKYSLPCLLFLCLRTEYDAALLSHYK